ncbi:MAG: hypothetical protein WDW38_006308 [Sanguina aurantia]
MAELEAFKKAFKPTGFTFKDAEVAQRALQSMQQIGMIAKSFAEEFEIYANSRQKITDKDLLQQRINTSQLTAFLAHCKKEGGGVGGSAQKKENRPASASGTPMAAGRPATASLHSPMGSAAVGRTPVGLGTAGAKAVRDTPLPTDQRTPKRQAVELSFTGGGTPTRAAMLSPMDSLTPRLTPPSPSACGAVFSARLNRGQVVASYNDHLRPAAAGGLSGGISGVVSSGGISGGLSSGGLSSGGLSSGGVSSGGAPGGPPAAAAAGVVLLELGEPLARGRHRFMMETLDTKVSAIDERISDFSLALRSALPASEAEAVRGSSVATILQEAEWVVGRVVCEAEGSALNPQSLLLEGGRESSGGARVRLDVGGLPSYRLFPGQVVAVKGVNPSGSTFIAQHIITHLPPAPHTSSDAAASSNAAASSPAAATGAPVTGPAAAPSQAQAEGCAAAAMSVVVAAGPFTTSEDLSFQPLSDLLAYCAEQAPDTLLLVGPFLDVEHPLVSCGLCERTFARVFQEEVVDRLRRGAPSSSSSSSSSSSDGAAPGSCSCHRCAMHTTAPSSRSRRSAGGS